MDLLPQVPTGAYGPLKNCSRLARRLERAGGGSLVVPTGGTMSGKVLALFDVDGTLTKPRNVRHAHQHARQRTLATGRGRSRSRQPSAVSARAAPAAAPATAALEGRDDEPRPAQHGAARRLLCR